MKVICGTECLNCSVQPLTEEELQSVRNSYKNNPTKRLREMAEKMLNGEVVRIYCIQRGRVMWVDIEKPPK